VETAEHPKEKIKPEQMYYTGSLKASIRAEERLSVLDNINLTQLINKVSETKL
jgi:hypothetical protein